MKNGIIAFCGAKGSGKNTAASILAEITGADVQELALAGHLKEVCSKVFDVDMKYFIDPDLKEIEFDNFRVMDEDKLLAIHELFNIVAQDPEKNTRPHLGKIFKTPRFLLQYVGTEVLRPLDLDIHVNIIEHKKNPSKLTLITDMRYANEFEGLKRIAGDNFLGVYVQNTAAEAAASVDSHSSEKGLEEFKNKCIRLENNGNLAEFTETVRVFVKEFLGES